MSLPGCGVFADVKQEVANTNAKPALDVDSFQQLLAAAYVIQQQNDGPREAKARPEHSQVLAGIVETQKQIQTRQLDLPSAAHLIAERVQRITQADGVAVGVLKDDQVCYAAAVGRAADSAGSSVVLKSCLSANSIRHGEILQCPDAEADFRLDPGLCRESETKSLIAVPVYHEGKIAGVLEVRFGELSAFEEQDVRSSQLMAGLVAEAIARSAEQEWKQVLAVERATMLEALERIKPQLERLAETPASEAAPVSTPAPPPPPAPVSCRCGNWLRVDEAFCGLCGTPRKQERSGNRDMQSKVASMWHLQQAAKQLDETPVEENVEAEDAEDSLPPVLEQIAAAEKALEDGGEIPSPEAPRKMWPVVPPRREVLEGEESARILPADGAAAPAAYPWVSAARARTWLESLKPRPGSRAWISSQWQVHRANIYLGAAIVLLLTVCISALAGWGTPPVTAGAALRPGVRVRVPQPQLSLMDRALVALGLAEVPAQPVVVYQGNPGTQVWVDTRTALYYCPGDDLYGKTDGGKLSTQRDAQLDQFEPAARKPCN